MGARGPLPKADAAGRRVRGGAVVALAAIEGGLSRKPEPNAGWLATTKRAFDDYLASDVARVVQNIDVAIIEDFFSAYDMWQKMMVAYRAEPFTEGSMGQTRVNPAAAQAHTHHQQMVSLAPLLGISPMGRQRLGIAVGKHAMTAAEVNEMVTKPRPQVNSRRKRTINEDWEAVD